MIVESTRNGHRSAYAAYFAGLLEDTQILFISDVGKTSALWRCLGAPRLLLSTADDYLLFAILLSALRILLLRGTQLILIRAEHVLDRNGVKALVKRVLYRLLRDLPLIRCITIMPHEVEPRLARLTNSSIYDPAFFELDSLDDNSRNLYGTDLTEGRMPDGVFFLGVLSEARNLGAFLEIFGPREDVDARACGRRAANLPDSALAEPGCVTVHEGHLDHLTFAQIFARAPSVWCAFRLDYDNFSGVFCNAVRFGTPVWVTQGSRLARFSQLHGGREVYRIKAGDQTFILYNRITVNLAEIGALNEAAFK